MEAPEHTLVLAAAGRVGTAVAILLQRAGYEIVGVASRTPGSAERASDRLGAPVVSLDDLPGAGVVLIGATDPGIPEVVERIAPSVAPGTVLWHLSGSLGRAALDGAPGARRAALHPVQACPDIETALARLPGSAWGITCDDDLRPWARATVASDLEGRPVDVAEADRVLWHAAAVTTANGIAALLAAGESVLAGIGIDDPVAVLGPLAAGALQNARDGGGGGATLTGPVVRGERDVVERHLAELRARTPELVSSYLAVARVVVEGARRAGRIDAATEAAMSALLEGE